MNGHLTDEQLGLAAAGTPLEEEAARHLEGCLTCRRQVEQLSAALAARRRAMEEEAPDWEAQWEAVMRSLPGSDRRRVRLWRPLAAAAAAAAAAVGLVVLAPHPHHESTPRIAVEQVLTEVNATLDSDPFEGFEPLEELVPDAQELATYAKATS